MEKGADNCLEALLAGLDLAGDVLEVCRVLLSHCVAHHAELVAAWSSQGHGGEVRLRMHLRDALLDGVPDESALGHRIASWLASRSPTTASDVALLARASAWAVAEVYRKTIHDRLCASGCVSLGDIGLLPTDSLDLRAMAPGASFSPAIDKAITEDPAATPWIRLLEEPGVGIRCTIEYGLTTSLKVSLGPGDRLPAIVTLHPVPEPPELAGDKPYQYVASMTVDEIEPNEARFFGGRPADDDGALQQIDRLLRLAEAENAGVVVLPEMTISDIDRIAELPILRELGVVVIGSAHCKRNGKRVNESALVVGGKVVWRYQKIHPFTWTPHGSAENEQQAVDLIEFLEYRGELRLFVAGPWRMLLAICSDLNSDAVNSAIKNLRPNLVLVPTWTPKPGYFEIRFIGYAGDLQAISVLANGPRVDPMAHSYIAFPFQTNQLAAHAGCPPFAAVFELATRAFRDLS